jgi:hypothetical protein
MDSCLSLTSLISFVYSTLAGIYNSDISYLHTSCDPLIYETAQQITLLSGDVRLHVHVHVSHLYLSIFPYYKFVVIDLLTILTKVFTCWFPSGKIRIRQKQTKQKPC